MVPWIQIYSNLPTHRKTAALAEELGLKSQYCEGTTLCVGFLIQLWAWAIQNAFDGDLKQISNKTLSRAAGWKKNPDKFVAALKATGWIDDDGHLHDWEEYANLYADYKNTQKEKTRERVRRYREREKAKAECNADCNVTCNACNAPTIQYNTNSSSSSNSTARARVEFIAHLFRDYTGRKPTLADHEKVFSYSDVGQDLLAWAFKTAAEAGHGGEWPYIDGIMRNLINSGIKDPVDAEYNTDQWRWGDTL